MPPSEEFSSDEEEEDAASESGSADRMVRAVSQMSKVLKEIYKEEKETAPNLGWAEILELWQAKGGCSPIASSLAQEQPSLDLPGVGEEAAGVGEEAATWSSKTERQGLGRVSPSHLSLPFVDQAASSLVPKPCASGDTEVRRTRLIDPRWFELVLAKLKDFAD